MCMKWREMHGILGDYKRILHCKALSRTLPADCLILLAYLVGENK